MTAPSGPARLLPALGPAVPQTPRCVLSSEETDLDDGFYRCVACGLSWPWHDPDADAVWDDPAAARCPSIDGRFLPGGHYASHAHPADRARLLQCMRPAGHRREHVNNDGGLRYWTADGAATAEQLAAVASLQGATA